MESIIEWFVIIFVVAKNFLASMSLVEWLLFLILALLYGHARDQRKELVSINNAIHEIRGELLAKKEDIND
tara:strand:- start:374 stop:586 length:213 start_codon:yes stop_codon:yes gene_type:complete